MHVFLLLDTSVTGVPLKVFVPQIGAQSVEYPAHGREHTVVQLPCRERMVRGRRPVESQEDCSGPPILAGRTPSRKAHLIHRLSCLLPCQSQISAGGSMPSRIPPSSSSATRRVPSGRRKLSPRSRGVDLAPDEMHRESPGTQAKRHRVRGMQQQRGGHRATARWSAPSSLLVTWSDVVPSLYH